MPRQASGRLTSSLKPISPAAFGYDQARHLLNRAGFGGTPDQVRTLAEWGPARSVDHLLDFEDDASYPRPDAHTFEADIMRPPTEEEQRAYRLALRNQDENEVAKFREARQQRQRLDRRQVRGMQEWWLTRMIETPRPMEEKLTLFWHGHFATSYRTIENSYHMFMQNKMFREHAAGNFGQMLFRIIRDPGMLRYLDNTSNRKNAPNENLARELMELFSLGEGMYEEGDIKEGARALTGYTFYHNDFIFNPDQHDEGTKNILGRRGRMDGDDFVQAILARRSCAEFICMKLYRYFVREVPGKDHDDYRPTVSVIRNLASTLAGQKYELRPMLRKMLLSEHFYADAVVGEHIKSPVELVVGAVRSLRTPVRDLGILVESLDLMGQNLLFPPNVAGWDGGRSWINTSTLFVRQNILNFLLTGKTPTGYSALAQIDRYDPSVLLADLARTDPGAERDPQRVVAYLLRFMLGPGERPERERVLLEFTHKHNDAITDDIVIALIALITAMPEYQLS